MMPSDNQLLLLMRSNSPFDRQGLGSQLEGKLNLTNCVRDSDDEF